MDTIDIPNAQPIQYTLADDLTILDKKKYFKEHLYLKSERKKSKGMEQKEHEKLYMGL